MDTSECELFCLLINPPLKKEKEEFSKCFYLIKNVSTEILQNPFVVKTKNKKTTLRPTYTSFPYVTVQSTAYK